MKKNRIRGNWYVVYYGFGIKKYLCYMDIGNIKSIDNYFFGSRTTFLKNIQKSRPILFKTEEKAQKFVEEFISSKGINFYRYDFSYEYLSSYDIPHCGRECWKCNKKYKRNCKNLQNKNQNICGFIMAEFDNDPVIEEGRLDAPCEQCITKDCPYYMGQ